MAEIPETTDARRVAHDLRNLLTPALMLTERLQSNADPAVRQIADRIARSLDRAVALLSSGQPPVTEALRGAVED